LMLYNDNSGKTIRIVVIDSGIDPFVCSLSDYIEESTGYRINDEGYIIEDNKMEIKHLHGTLISLIISHLCRHVKFISINILDEKLTSDGRVLLAALEKGIAYKPDIVHLSLGTTRLRYIFPLRKLICEAMKQNILIISAVSNEGRRSYPACLKGVIGVKADINHRFKIFGYENGFYYAPFRTDGIDGINEINAKTCAAGTSISAAYVTGYIASEMYTRSLKDIKSIANTIRFNFINNVKG
jgi:hypothetical protein